MCRSYVSVSIYRVADGKARMMAPGGPAGARPADGSQPIALPFEHCAGPGCEAADNKTALAKFETGKTLVVRYVVTDKASADIPITLTGLADALASLSK